MGIRSQKEIYQVLEKHLKASPKAMTCVELMDIPDIRSAALAEYGPDIRNAINKVSDALGLMWRREFIKRFPAPAESNTLARYAYTWAAKTTPVVSIPSPVSSRKTGLIITEQEDGVFIELDKFTVLIRPK